MDRLFLVCLVACVWISYAVAECQTCCSKSGGSTKPTIDYVQLTVQNAKGYCSINKCTAPVDGWTIHGLWPSQIGAMGPNGCNATAKFDEGLLSQELINKMNNEWPTLYGGDSTGFWTHEWCKHGTCAMNVPSIARVTDMQSYFATAIDLFESLNIDKTISNSGIEHSSDNTYQLSKFSNLFDTKPAFECTSHNDGQLMFQARFCFTSDLKPADCNMNWFASIKSCDETLPIYYP